MQVSLCSDSLNKHVYFKQSITSGEVRLKTEGERIEGLAGSLGFFNP